MIPLVTNFLESYQSYLQPLFFVMAWVSVTLVILSIFQGIKSVVKSAKKMHEIPCTNCEYFVNSYYLKCSVNPHIANTELAKECFDFKEKGN